jgi:hypothetical protein
MLRRPQLAGRVRLPGVLVIAIGFTHAPLAFG